uniref:Peptidase M24 domain-containing protein n=1 Tax=Pyxicephalus adspersus TaxID=30357 RepID=A0AAV3A647_PYXAD|nr:TPA: hypothetical protein GDO54_015602 [Pyxicephalus adspersus]
MHISYLLKETWGKPKKTSARPNVIAYQWITDSYVTGCQRVFSAPINHIFLHRQLSIQQRRCFFLRRQRSTAYSIVWPGTVSPAHPVPEVYSGGYHGDTSETFLVGNVDEGGRKLVETAKKCRDEAIAACRPGAPLSVIGNTISRIAKENNFQVCPHFIGHGIGSYFHGHPEIWHHENVNNMEMEEGMAFTIEPIILEGSPQFKILKDNWTAMSRDNKRSAQFEHTIVITSVGAEILTKAPEE